MFTYLLTYLLTCFPLRQRHYISTLQFSDSGYANKLGVRTCAGPVLTGQFDRLSGSATNFDYFPFCHNAFLVALAYRENGVKITVIKAGLKKVATH